MAAKWNLLALGISALILVNHGNAMSADAGTNTSPTTVSVTRLLENERVDVARMVSKPGDKGAMRQRPDRVLHIVRGAKVRFHYPDGRTEEAVWKAGDVVYQEADSRQVENIDTQELEYLSVHLK